MEKLLSLVLIGILVASFFSTIMLAHNNALGLANLSSQVQNSAEWSQVSLNGVNYQLYAISNPQISNPYERPLYITQDTSLTSVYATKDNGDPVGDTTLAGNLTIDAENNAYFLQLSPIWFSTITNLQLLTESRTDSSGNAYSLVVPAGLPTWWTADFLYGTTLNQGLDNFAYRTDMYSKVFLEIAVQTALYNQLSSNPTLFNVLRTVLNGAAILSGNSATVLSDVQMILSGAQNFVLPSKDVRSLLDLIRRVPAKNELDNSALSNLGILAGAVGVVSSAYTLTADALQFYILGSLANAQAQERLNAISYFLQHNTNSIDPAIIAGVARAQSDFTQIVNGYYDNIVNCLKANPTDLINLGVATASLALAFSPELSVVALPYLISYQIYSELLSSLDQMQTACMAATIEQMLAGQIPSIQGLAAYQTQIRNAAYPAEDTTLTVLNLYNIDNYLSFFFFTKMAEALNIPGYTQFGDFFSYLLGGTTPDNAISLYNQMASNKLTYTVETNSPCFLTGMQPSGASESIHDWLLQMVIPTPAPTMYSVTFSESGLATGTQWSVTFNGQTESSTTNSIPFSVPNGNYGYSITAPSGYTLPASEQSGSVTVNGNPVPENMVFTANPSYSVTLSAPVVYGLSVSISGAATPNLEVSNIKWDWGDGSVISLGFPGSHTYAKSGNYVVTVTAYYKDGSTVSSWESVTVSNVIYTFEIMFAGYGSGSVSWSYSLGSGSISTPSEVYLPVSAGMQITLTAVPSAGSGLAGWSGASGVTLANPYSLITTVTTYQGNGEVFAYFIQTNTLSLSSLQGGSVSYSYTGLPSGTVSGTVSSGQATTLSTIEGGTQISLTATPSSGCIFSSWFANGPVSVASSSSASTTLTVSGNGGSVAAVFSSINSAGDPNSWPMFHNDVAHSGSSVSTAPTSNQTLWLDALGSGSITYSSPAVANGILYMGSWWVSYAAGGLWAFNASSGKEIWDYNNGWPVDDSPAVSNGLVYAALGDGYVYAFDALTGAVLWSQLTKVDARMYSSPTVANGYVYIGSINGYLYAFNAQTGAKIWSIDPSGYQAPIYSSPAVVNGILYIGGGDGILYAFNAMTDKQLWNSTFLNGPIYSSPTVLDGAVYISSGNMFYAFNVTTGAQLWSFASPSGSNFGFASPAATNGIIYVGCQDNTPFYALNATNGLSIWSSNIITSYSSPAFGDGMVFVGTIDGHLQALNATTGGFLWSYLTGGAVESSPAIAAGDVFVGSGDGSLYAFGIPLYPVTFTESGLPTGTQWAVTVNGQTLYSTTSTLSLNLTNGDYPFSVTSPMGYVTNKNSGDAVVNGVAVTENIPFSAQMYSITFQPTGLPSGTAWTVTADGQTYGPSVGNLVINNLQFGNHNFVVQSPISGGAGIRYVANVTQLNVIVPGTLFVSINFATQYQLSIATSAGGETSVPSGTYWYAPDLQMSIVPYADAGYLFNGWIGSGSGSYSGAGSSSGALNSANITMNGSVTETANFKLGSVLVTFSSNPTLAGSSVSCTATISGVNPTGTISWSTNCSTGQFSSSTTSLVSGTSTSNYTDMSSGTVNITAQYSGDSNNPPCICSDTITVINSNPSLVVRGENNQIYYRAYNPTTASWGSWNSLPGFTPNSPAACAIGDHLHIVVRGANNDQIWYGSVNLTDSSFSGWTLLSGSTPSTPTLSSNGTALGLTVRGENNRIYYRFYTIASQTWSDWSVLPSGTTLDSPTASLVGNELYIVVRGTDGSTLWYSNVNQTTGAFSGWTLLSGSTPSTPTLTSSSTVLALVVRGGDNRIYYQFYSITTNAWTGWTALPSGTTLDSPAATILQSTLWVVVRGSDGSSLWQSSIDEEMNAFSGWTLLSGSTPSKPTLTS